MPRIGCPAEGGVATYAEEVRTWTPRLAGVGIGLGIALCGSLGIAPGAASLTAAQEPPPTQPGSSGRTALVEVPVGCPIQPLPDVVFVGTVVDSDFRTARFRIDQHRAGEIGQFAVDGLVDVRYGIDTKYLGEGAQYLIAATYDANIGGLRSRVQPERPVYGGDEIIGATESDLVCPEVADPMRTIHVDGSSVDTGLLSPIVNDRQGWLRVLVIPIVLVVGTIFALASIRWILTGFGRGVENLATSSNRARAVRQRPRQRQPVPVGASGGPVGRQPTRGRSPTGPPPDARPQDGPRRTARRGRR